MHQRLLVIQNGRRSEAWVEALRHGALGNEQTLAIAAEMVREDAALDFELRRVAQQIVAGCAPRDRECEIGKLFEFVQAIRHVDDPVGVERIADAWTTINEQFGDCGDKAILLASLLGTRGYVTRFAVVEFHGDAIEQDGYDHVYIEVLMPDGTWWPLDADAENRPAGFEATARAKATYEIFNSGPVLDVPFGVPAPDTSNGLGDWQSDLFQFGLQFGTQWAQSAVQQSQISGEQSRQIGAEFDRRAGEVTAIFDQIQRQPIITVADLQRAVQAYEQLAAVAQEWGAVAYVAQQWTSSAYKPAYEQRLQDMAQRVVTAAETATPANPPGSNTGGLAVESFTELSASNPLLWLGVGLVAAKVVFK